MPNDNVIRLVQPGAFDDQLTEVLRNGARALLAQAVESEVAGFLGKHSDLKTEDGRLRLDTWTLNRAIPKVDIDGFPTQTCELVPVPETERLGVQYLLRISVEGALQNTLRLKEMEAVVCPGPYAGTARVADLTAGKPSFSTVAVSNVRGLAGAIVAPLP